MNLKYFKLREAIRQKSFKVRTVAKQGGGTASKPFYFKCSLTENFPMKGGGNEKIHEKTLKNSVQTFILLLLSFLNLLNLTFVFTPTFLIQQFFFICRSLRGVFYLAWQSLWCAFYPEGQSLCLTSPKKSIYHGNCITFKHSKNLK